MGCPEPILDPPDHPFVVFAEPVRTLSAPSRKAAPANEVDVLRAEGFLDRSIPVLVDLLVVVDESYQVAVGGGNSRVQRERFARARLRKVWEAATKGRRARRPELTRAVRRIVVDDREAYIQARRDVCAEQTVQRAREESLPVVGRQHHVELQRRAAHAAAVLSTRDAPNAGRSSSINAYNSSTARSVAVPGR